MKVIRHATAVDISIAVGIMVAVGVVATYILNTIFAKSVAIAMQITH
jgi:hypothetical protein